MRRERMRQYERDRMRYYYAVVEFDSVDTVRGREGGGMGGGGAGCELG